MSKKSGISLKSFYIFNSECGPKEGEVCLIQLLLRIICLTKHIFTGRKENFILSPHCGKHWYEN